MYRFKLVAFVTATVSILRGYLPKSGEAKSSFEIFSAAYCAHLWANKTGNKLAMGTVSYRNEIFTRLNSFLNLYIATFSH